MANSELDGVDVISVHSSDGSIIIEGSGAVDLRAGGGGPPTGVAGGDLSGFYPNPLVDGLQGTAVSPAAPAAGNVLTIVAGVWTPAAPAGGAPSGPAGGDLSGTFPNPVVDGLQTVAVSAVAPVNGQVLTLVGGVWTGAAPAGGPPTGAAGGDLSGTFPNPVVDALQTVAISAVAPVNGQVLTLVGGVWTGAAPAGGAPSGPAGGDLSGTFPNPVVDGLQTVALSATGPVDGDLLIFDGAGWNHSASDSAGNTILLNTGAEAATITYGALANAVTIGQVQDPAAAGAPWSIRAQRGFGGGGGFVGGALTIGGGDPGINGTNLAGNTFIQLGTDVGLATARMGFLSGATEIGSVSATGGFLTFTNIGVAPVAQGARIVAVGTVAVQGGTADIEAAGSIFMVTGTGDIQWFGAGGAVRTDLLAVAGTTYTMAEAVASTLYTQATRTSDAVTHQFSIVSQAPFAGATGANRTPGTLRLAVPATVGGGAEGHLRIEIGATALSYTRNIFGVSDFDTIYEAPSFTTFTQGAAGVDGFPWLLATLSPPAVGARAHGGDISFETGAGDGNAGAAARGGDFTFLAGQGSSSGGLGGSYVMTTGDGGTGGGGSGDFAVVIGVPDGAGPLGRFSVYQGGIGGQPVLTLDPTGIFHIGKDGDGAGGQIRLRLNGQAAVTVGAAGGAAALPATPLGYYHVNVNAVDVAIPFYNP